MKILFVCTGNTCRSPMAEALFNKIVQNKGLSCRADSCGICTISGLPASENSRLACEEMGVDLSEFKSTAIDEVTLSDYDFVVCMTQGHKDILLSFGVSADNLLVLGEDKGGIADPYGGDLGRYIICRNEMISAFEELFSRLSKDNRVSLRKLDLAEANAVHGLVKGSFSTPWSVATIESMLQSENAVLIGAFIGDILVGFTSLEWVLDEGSLTEIVVSKDHRRRGIANKLMEELLKTADEKQISFVTLEVRESNSPAISLYKKFDFEEVGVRKNYYKNPTENALLMTRK